MLEQRREQMPLDVIDADERNPGRLREPLRAHQADQQRADQSRPARDRDTADIGEIAARLRHRAFDNRHHRDHMVARREFRNDPTIKPDGCRPDSRPRWSEFSRRPRVRFRKPPPRRHRMNFRFRGSASSNYQSSTGRYGAGTGADDWRGGGGNSAAVRWRFPPTVRREVPPGAEPAASRGGLLAAQPGQADARHQVARHGDQRLLVAGDRGSGLAGLLIGQDLRMRASRRAIRIGAEMGFGAVKKCDRLIVVFFPEVRAAQIKVGVRIGASIEIARVRVWIASSS